jgi:hypothetical protein
MWNVLCCARLIHLSSAHSATQSIFCYITPHHIFLQNLISAKLLCHLESFYIPMSCNHNHSYKAFMIRDCWCPNLQHGEWVKKGGATLATFKSPIINLKKWLQSQARNQPASCFTYSLTLKMQVVRSSEMFMDVHRTTQSYNWEDSRNRCSTSHMWST